MALRIDSGQLRDTINGILEEYGDEARDAIEESAKSTAKDLAKELRSAGTFKGGEDFKKGWSSKVEKGRLGSSAVVYNKTKPGLAHLLEFGHAKANGGRTRAFNFIAPIADTAEEKFEKAFAERMNK